MGDLAVAVIVGRLTRDAELKYTNSGQAVCHFAVATGARVKKGDQWVEESSFWDVDLWGKRAESVNQYLTKGKLVAVQGDMRIERWEQDGQTRSKVRITANDVQLLGGGSGEGRPAGSYQGGGSDRGQGGEGGRPAYPPRDGGRDGARESGRQDYRQDGRGYGSQGPAPRGNDRGPAPAGDDFTDDIPF